MFAPPAVAPALAVAPAKPPSLNLHFANYLDDETDVGNRYDKYNEIMKNFRETGTMNGIMNQQNIKTDDIKGGIKGLLALSKSRPKMKPLPVLPPPEIRTMRPPENPLPPAPNSEERRKRQEERLKFIASLSKERISYIKAFVKLQKENTVEDLKDKIMTDFNVESWRLGRLEKSDLIKIYLEKMGLTPPEKKKKGKQGRAND